MRRTLASIGSGMIALLLAGCSTGPLVENPLRLRTERVALQENPVYIPQGPMSYARVFEKAIDVLDDFFEISYTNRYAGIIETFPRIAPGIEQPWKPGSPDFYQRLLAFCQTIRHRALVQIRPAVDGGYWIDVKVLKELEDLPAPQQYTMGMSVFRYNTATVERQFEVIEPVLYEPNWIPIGRDYKLEQVILQRLADCDLTVLPDTPPPPSPEEAASRLGKESMLHATQPGGR